MIDLDQLERLAEQRERLHAAIERLRWCLNLMLLDGFERDELEKLRRDVMAFTASGVSDSKGMKMREWNDTVPEERHASYTAADLQWMEFPPLKFAIPDYVVEGLTILVGKPKRGKSWMALDWLLAISHGGKALGTIQVDVGDCLHMALEDGKRRMQRRIRQLLPSTPEWTPRLTIRHKMKKLDQGGLDKIREWAGNVALPRLVVIDTFVKVRPRRQEKTEHQYDADYHAMSLLQELAPDLSLAIVVIHHQRKMESEDPLDTASGSTGLTGAADSILVLNRDGQGPTLYGRGRDLKISTWLSHSTTRRADGRSWAPPTRSASRRLDRPSWRFCKRHPRR